MTISPSAARPVRGSANADSSAGPSARNSEAIPAIRNVQYAITAFDVAAVAFDELTDVFLHFGCICDADAELLCHKGVVAHGETIAEVAHMPAAVVRPLIDEEFRSRKITPAPRKEMPLTTCVAIRPGSELRPAIPKSTRSTKQYFDRIMITADVTAMMQCVRIPAPLHAAPGWKQSILPWHLPSFLKNTAPTQENGAF